MKHSNLPVALTGATGFLGSHLADLLLSRGRPLVAAVRNPAKAAGLASRGAEVRVADLAHEQTLVEAFRGCGAVIANAAIAVGWSPVDASAFEVNATGTESTMRAAARAGLGARRGAWPRPDRRPAGPDLWAWRRQVDRSLCRVLGAPRTVRPDRVHSVWARR